MNTAMLTPARTVTADMLAPLPAPVQRYLTYSGVVGQPWIDTVAIQYKGKFRLGADKPWMSIRVHQFYTTHSPGFLWKARFSMAGLPILTAVDTYRDGHGRMLGKAAGLFTVVDGSGEKIDLGTMTRYLQEISWFPAAYLSDYITWTAVDDHSADVTLTAYGKQVSARMFFDDEGRPLSFIARRWGDFNGNARLETWTAPTYEYRRMAGLNLPVRGEAVWHLPEGDLAYIDIELTDVAYNVEIPAF
ncbi:MAG: hypothetical protein IPK19_16065 [Chloroflexi bacterium]|nr:hypothetical protein [Chloroflexota bacterium]